jgi:hypothetical protein
MTGCSKKLNHAVYGAMLKLCGACKSVVQLENIYLQMAQDTNVRCSMREFNIALSAFVQV